MKPVNNIEKMFDEISSQYDFMNNIISFYTHYSIKKESLKLLDFKIQSLKTTSLNPKIKKEKTDNNLNNSIKILDLCCGSGDLGGILHKKYPDIKIIGVDFSEKMLEIAREKNKEIEYLKMNAQNLAFENESFDCVVMGFGLRNVEDKTKCLSEIYRILKSGGVFLHLDYGRKNLISRIYDFIVLFLVNFFVNEKYGNEKKCNKKNFNKENFNKKAYKYLINSKNKFPEPEKLIENFKQTGFKNPIVRYFCFKNISAQILEK